MSDHLFALPSDAFAVTSDDGQANTCPHGSATGIDVARAYLGEVER